VSNELKERALLYKLIDRLIRLCQGLDRELDNRLGKLRAQLDKNVAIASLEPELEKLNELLKLQLSRRDENTQKLVDIIDQFGTSLQKIKGLPPQLRRDLRSFMQDDEAYGSFEHQQRLMTLFEFYYQTMEHKETLAQATETSSTNSKHQIYCNELQQIVSDLEVNQGQSSQLTEVRTKLFDGASVDELPALFMTVIQHIVEDLKTERSSSQDFLSSLDDSLTQFLSSFSQTVSDSKQLSSQNTNINQAIKEGIANLNSDLSGSQELAELKTSISEHLSKITSHFAQKESLGLRENQLVERLNKMELRLSEMKNETADYKKRLSTQQELLFIDALTGIPNRAALDERVDMEYKRWQRYKHSLAIAVIDIDLFKKINDTYGHLAGDKALKVIATALKKSMRETDFIARFGGEEFVLILPNLKPEALQKPLDLLRKKIKAIPFKFKGAQVSISISIGATLFKENDKIDDALERADQALYAAKEAGRDATIITL